MYMYPRYVIGEENGTAWFYSKPVVDSSLFFDSILVNRVDSAPECSGGVDAVTAVIRHEENPVQETVTITGNDGIVLSHTGLSGDANKRVAVFGCLVPGEYTVISTGFSSDIESIIQFDEYGEYYFFFSCESPTECELTVE